MIRTLLLIAFCGLVSSCETLDNIHNDRALNTIGSFELNPVQVNNYWYNGRSYEYNQYQIEITAEPVEADIEWNGEAIGTTPFIYSFTGVLDKGDYIKVRAVPLDKNLPAQIAALRISTELPRKINFDLRKNKK